MSDVHYCPNCGAELSAGAAEQPCPACLMKLALDAGWPGDSKSPTAHYAAGFKAPTIEEISSRLPQFEVLELVGKGGMGAVYRARQKSLDRVVAVKIINPEAAKQPGFAERFGREARAMARLNHANIVTIHDFGETAGSTQPDAMATENREPIFYLVMEYVDGTNLRELMREKRLTPAEALQIVPHLCDALQYAHEEGIVHRDIKPENILIDQKGRVKIADFGLAKLLGQTPRDITLTEAHHALGTLHYMAPEQLERPLEVDHRADIYALGVTFYEMLTGELPIARFALPSQKAHIDVRLDEVVLRALEREPERRYQHASDIRSDVESISDSSHRATFGTAAENPAEVAEIKAAQRRVLLPAIGILCMGLLLLLCVALPVAMNTLADLHRLAQKPHGEFAIPLLLVIIAIPVGMIVGAVKMLRLSSYRWALVATALMLLPFPVTVILLMTIPLGVWSLFVLNNPKVKRGFRLRQQTRAAENARHTVAGSQSFVPFPPGSGPRMLALAIGLAKSALVATMGAAMIFYGLAAYPAGNSQWSGFIGGGFGSLIGGLGGFLGVWNKLRMYRGKLDIMYEPQWNFLDTIFIGYALFGIASLAAGMIWWPALDRGLKLVAVLLGGIALIQGLGFAAWRLALRRSAARPDDQPALDLRLILIAVAMIVCAMLMFSGIALGVVAAVRYPGGSPEFWSWMGPAFGCAIGGGGGLLGTWNSYRAMEGLPDWIAEGRTNAFDRWVYAVFGFGVALMIVGLVASRWVTPVSVYSLELFGGILVFQTAIFIPIRALMRRAAKQEAEHASKL